MILNRICCELVGIRTELKRTNDILDVITKRISILHNSKNIANSKPLAWLTPEQRIRANKLKDKNPEMYKSVVAILALYLGED